MAELKEPRMIGFRPGELGPALEERGGQNSYTLRTMLERYLYALHEELDSLRLSQGEACLILDACNGTLWTEHSAGLLWAEVADALEDGLDAKWEVDGPALVEKLRRLTYSQSLAVVDAVERWWADPDDTAGRVVSLRRVGLLP